MGTHYLQMRNERRVGRVLVDLNDFVPSVDDFRLVVHQLAVRMDNAPLTAVVARLLGHRLCMRSARRKNPNEAARHGSIGRNGHPVRIDLTHGNGDAPTLAQPLLQRVDHDVLLLDLIHHCHTVRGEDQAQHTYGSLSACPACSL